MFKRRLLLLMLAAALMAAIAAAQLLTVVEEPPPAIIATQGSSFSLPFAVNVSNTDGIVLNVTINTTYDPGITSFSDAYVVLSNGTTLPLNTTVNATAGIVEASGFYNLTGSPPGIVYAYLVFAADNPGSSNMSWYYNISAITAVPSPGGGYLLVLLENVTGSNTTLLTVERRMVGGLAELAGSSPALQAAALVAAAAAVAVALRRR